MVRIRIFSAYDNLYQRFGDTAINRVDPRVTDENLFPYLLSAASWLFDRASTLYQLAFRSGDVKFIRESHRAAQFYAIHINSAGYFDLKSNDMKYSYGESLTSNYILVGDESVKAVVRRMIPAWDSFNAVYTLKTNFWTERHSAYKLLGYITSFELLGDQEFGQKAKDTFTILYNMQNNPVEGLPVTGGLMHTSKAHGEGGSDIISSPWMSTLLLDAVERYYIHSGDSRVPDFVMDYGGFL